MKNIYMKNEIQIIGNKVYYKMVCVAILNELAYSNELLEFKRLLTKLNKERNEHESN